MSGRRWIPGGGALLLAAVAFSAPGASAHRVVPNPCLSMVSFVKSTFHVTTPPGMGTGTLPGGATSTTCSFGSTIYIQIEKPATEATYNANSPKSATPVKAACTQAKTESGTNTDAITNAKTGKTKMVTKETTNVYCYNKSKPNVVWQIDIVDLDAAAAKSNLGGLLKFIGQMNGYWGEHGGP